MHRRTLAQSRRHTKACGTSDYCLFSYYATASYAWRLASRNKVIVRLLHNLMEIEGNRSVREGSRFVGQETRKDVGR